jgi:hypothetical protein
MNEQTRGKTFSYTFQTFLMTASRIAVLEATLRPSFACYNSPIPKIKATLSPSRNTNHFPKLSPKFTPPPASLADWRST